MIRRVVFGNPPIFPNNIETLNEGLRRRKPLDVLAILWSKDIPEYRDMHITELEKELDPEATGSVSINSKWQLLFFFNFKGSLVILGVPKEKPVEESAAFYVFGTVSTSELERLTERLIEAM